MRPLAIAVACSSAACSLLVDTGGLSTSGPASDAGADGAIIVDASTDGGADSSIVRSYRDEVLADAPITYLRFEETMGVVAVDETKKHDGSYLGSFELGAPGIVRSSERAVRLKLPGGVELDSKDYDRDGRKPFSVELWFVVDALDDTYRYLYNRQIAGDATRRGFGVFLHGTTLAAERHVTGLSDGGYASADTAIVPGTVNHVVATYDGSTVRIWLNGVKSGTDADTRSIESIDRKGYVGTGTLTGGTVAGVVDELAFYGKALGPERVAAHYQAGKR